MSKHCVGSRSAYTLLPELQGEGKAGQADEHGKEVIGDGGAA